MCASPLSIFRSGPPPPKVALLSDGLFFWRAVPIVSAASPAEVATQVELALEAIAPFPLNQMYYGWYWAPGAETALVFAAYRRRFTTDQTAEWEGAELVLPTAVALFGAADVAPATTLLFTAPDGLTAVHWDAPPVPAKVLHHPLAADATPEQLNAAREALLKSVGGTKTLVEVPAAPAAAPRPNDREFIFTSGDVTSRLATESGAAVDVRDKADLAALRASRGRDLLLWRLTLGSAALLALLALGELGLIAANAWQDLRERRVAAQKPLVQKIENSDLLARRIDELATKRLLPFEMATMLFVPEGRKPAEILFNRISASVEAGIYTLTVEAKSSSTAQVSAYESALMKVPEFERVEIRNIKTVGDSATFVLVVTFKPQAVSPATSIL